MAFKRKGSWARRVATFANGAMQGYNQYKRLKMQHKYGGSGSRTQRGVRHAPGPITGESDYRSVYRRKPMPKRRRRSWVKFTRKVKSVQEKQVAPQFQVIRRSGTAVTGSGGQNISSLFTILGAAGQSGAASNAETDDISDMATSALAMAGSTGITVGSNTGLTGIRLHISGWMAEVMINNNGTNTTYLDCYYWRAKKDVPKDLDNMDKLLNRGFSQLNVPLAGAATTALGYTQYGVTPFQCPLFSQCFQVYKKTRIKLGGGGTAQLELRSGKNYYRKMSYDHQFSYVRGASEGILFFQYGTPNTLNPIASPTDISYSVNVNYTWRRMSDDRMTGGVGTD